MKYYNIHSGDELPYNKWVELFEELDDSIKVRIWNEFCEDNRYYEDILYTEGEIMQFVANATPLDVFEYGKQMEESDYYKFNDGIESADISDIDVSDIHRWNECCIDDYTDIDCMFDDEEDE